MKLCYIVWARHDRRPELLAQHLNACLHFIYSGQRGKRLQAPLRYLTQARETYSTLRSDKPDVVFVQNPPIFAVLTVLLYCWRHGARLMIDAHSGAFKANWRWSVPLLHLASKTALMTLVHNTGQEEIVKKWGCPYRVVGFTPGDYPAGEPYPLGHRFNVAVISTFGEDEPLPAILSAAHEMPDVDFYLTGDAKRFPSSLAEKKSQNCHLTGYLSYECYVGLLRGVDAILDLTTCNHTLLMGGFEAVSLDKPLIVSNWPTLCNYFSLGTVHVPNTAEGICSGVRTAQSKRAELQQEMTHLHRRLDAEWEQNLSALKQLLQA